MSIPERERVFENSIVEPIRWEIQNAFFDPIEYDSQERTIIINKEGRYKITLSLCGRLEGDFSNRPGILMFLRCQDFPIIKTSLGAQSTQGLPPSSSNHAIINITNEDLPYVIESRIIVSIQTSTSPAYLLQTSLFIERSGSAQSIVYFTPATP